MRSIEEQIIGVMPECNIVVEKESKCGGNTRFRKKDYAYIYF